MKLTIGIPVYDDYSGIFMTVNALRHYHDLSETELLIIDNNSDSVQGNAVRCFIASIPQKEVQTRYVTLSEHIGPANAKNAVFEYAEAGYVLCIDSHVLLVKDAVSNLKYFYKKFPDTSDLYHGSLYQDNLHPWCAWTHMRPNWGSGMKGQWSTAWLTNTNDIVQTYMKDNKLRTTFLSNNKEYPDTPDLDWSNHEERLNSLGWRVALRDTPLEIPAHGTGLLSCRKDAWLKFNPLFREFGGEECYIHEKFRQAGHTSYCLPFLSWQHRFFQDKPITYPRQTLARFRNYILGHRELGLDVTEVVNEFQSLGLSTQEIRKVLQNPEDYTPSPVYVKSTKVSEQFNSRIDLYNWLSKQPRDLDESAEYLKRLSTNCPSVTEITNRRESSIFLLAGNPESLVSYQEENDAILQTTHDLLNKENHRKAITWKLVTGIFNEPPIIEETDVLFINSEPTYTRLVQELKTNSHKVRQHLVINSTEAFGPVHESGDPGLWKAIQEFLVSNPEWFTVDHRKVQRGITVLSRVPGNKPKYPIIPWPIYQGVGSEIKRLLEVCWFKPIPNCSCDTHAMAMNRLGPQWCKDNTHIIVGWLKKGYAQRGFPLPFSGLIAKWIVRLAIKLTTNKLTYPTEWTNWTNA